MPLVLLAVAMALIGALHAYFISPPIQADCIYIVSMASDFARHPPIVQWWLPPANGFFPDVLVGFAGYAFGLHGFNNTVFVHAFFCGWTFLAAFAWLRAGGIAAFPALAAATFGVATFDFLYRSDTLLTWTLLVPTCHDGIIGFELLGAALYLRFVARGERSALTALFAVTLVGVFSDRIVAVQYAFPIALLALAKWAYDRKRRAPIAFAAITAGTLCGVLSLRLLDLSGIFQTASIPQMMHFPFGRAQLDDILTHLASITGVVHAAIYTVAYIALLILVVSMRRFPLQAQLILGAALMSAASLLTPIVSQIWVDQSAIRYQLPFFLLPALVVAGIALNEVAVRNRGVGKSYSAAAILLVIAAGMWINAPGLAKVHMAESRFAADVGPLVQSLSQQGTEAVLAPYWMAKPLLFVSNYSLKVCQITDQGDVYPWIADIGWCASADTAMRQGQQASVAVVDYGTSLDESQLRARYGAPTRVMQIAGYRVFYFPASSVDSRLRSQICGMVPALRGRTFGCS